MTGTASFPALLRAAREARGWTQGELARKVGLERGAVAHFENGHNLPSLEAFVRLLDVLGVSADALLGRSSSNVARRRGGTKR